jgi:hypothetical protein
MESTEEGMRAQLQSHGRRDWRTPFTIRTADHLALSPQSECRRSDVSGSKVVVTTSVEVTVIVTAPVENRWIDRRSSGDGSVVHGPAQRVHSVPHGREPPLGMAAS